MPTADIISCSNINMPQKPTANDILNYYKTTETLIWDTLNNINDGASSEISHLEMQLISEFAASFSVKEWAKNQQRWQLKGRTLWKRRALPKDLKLILKAHKAGAWFDKIVIKNTTFTEVSFALPSELHSDIPSLYVYNNFKSDSL